MDLPERAPGRAAYEQLPDEPALWFGRFQAFLQLGPSRSVLGAFIASKAAQGSTNPAPQQAPGSWKSAASRYSWVDRARAWDARGQQVAVEAREETIRQDAAARTREEIRNERRLHIEDDGYDLSELLIAKAREMLGHGLHRKKAVSPDGKTIFFEPARWNMRTALQAIDLAERLRRMSARMPAKAEEEPAGDCGAEFFETSGQLSDVLPEKVTPEMPADVFVKPPIAIQKTEAGKNGAPSQPRIEKPTKLM